MLAAPMGGAADRVSSCVCRFRLHDDGSGMDDCYLRYGRLHSCWVRIGLGFVSATDAGCGPCCAAADMGARGFASHNIFAAAFYLLRPFLPNPAETKTTVFAIRQTPLGKPFTDLDWSAFGGMPHLDKIPGGLFSPVSLSTFSMSDKRKSRVLLMMFDQEIPEEALNVPRTGDAIYSEKNHQWTALLKPERKGSFRIKVSREFGVVSVGECCHSGGSTNFTYPPRPIDKLTPGGRGGF
jgi:hypothetical protein